MQAGLKKCDTPLFRAVQRVVAIVVMVATATSVAGCGYSLAGRGSFLPSYIQTIGIPLLENVTPAFELEQILTEKIRAEFIGRGRYKILPQREGADAVLLGRITNVGLVPVSFTSDQQAARYELRVTAAFQFRDVKDDRILWENLALVFREEYDITTASGALDPAAFFGQETTAIDRLGTNFAKTVVTAILEAF